jgi:hypothetical protein
LTSCQASPAKLGYIARTQLHQTRWLSATRLQRAWHRRANGLRLAPSHVNRDGPMGRASEPERRDRQLWRRAVLITVAILTSLATVGAAAETKRVLMLFSNDSLLPAGNAVASNFQRTLETNNPDRVEIFTEFLDADRFPGSAHEARMESARGRGSRRRVQAALPRWRGRSAQLRR